MLGYSPVFEEGWKELDTVGCLEDGVEARRAGFLISPSSGSLVSFEMDVELGGEVVMFVLRAVDGVLGLRWRVR